MKRLIILVVAIGVGAGIGAILAHRSNSTPSTDNAQAEGATTSPDGAAAQQEDELAFLKQAKEDTSGTFAKQLPEDMSALKEAFKAELQKDEAYKKFQSCTDKTPECNQALSTALENALHDPLNELLRSGRCPSFGRILANREAYAKYVDNVIVSSEDPIERILAIKLAELASYSGEVSLPAVAYDNLTTLSDPEAELALSEQFKLPQPPSAQLVAALASVSSNEQRSMAVRSAALIALSRLGQQRELAAGLESIFSSGEPSDEVLESDAIGRALTTCSVLCMPVFEKLAANDKNPKAQSMLKMATIRVSDVKERGDIIARLSTLHPRTVDWERTIKGTPFDRPQPE